MLILAVGDSVRSNTGYGNVSRHVFHHFLKKGHTIMQVGWQHSEPPERVIIADKSGIVGTVTMFPPHTTDEFSTASTVMHINTSKPHLVYNSNDIFTSSILVKQRSILQHPMFLANYGVLDAPDAAEWFKDTILNTDVLITPSKFGFEQLQKITKTGLYIPHGVDISVYHPMENKAGLKSKLGLTDKFVFGAVHRNIVRKLIPYIVESFANLKHVHKLKDIVLLLVMDPVDSYGYDVFALAKRHNLTVSWSPTQSADIMLHPKHLNYTISLTDDELAEAYNTFDVLVSATMSEGFGLPTLEAQACGTPVIIPNHSANTELVEGHGWLYPTAKNSDGSDTLFPMKMSAGGQQIMYGYPVPDRIALEQAMLESYNNSELRKKYGKDSTDFAKPYNWDLVLPLWDQVLEKAEQFWETRKKQQLEKVEEKKDGAN